MGHVCINEHLVSFVTARSFQNGCVVEVIRRMHGKVAREETISYI